MPLDASRQFSCPSTPIVRRWSTRKGRVRAQAVGMWRAVLGALPVQRRKAREKADCSEKPRRKPISLKERIGDGSLGQLAPHPFEELGVAWSPAPLACF